MNTPAEIICQLLIDLGHAEESGSTWPIYVSFLPDFPHEAICVYDTAGSPDGRLMIDGTRIEHPGIQIRIRGQSYPDIWQKANAIALALDSSANTLISLDGGFAYIIHNISRTGTIIPVGVDEKDDHRRHHFTINAVVTIPNEEDYVFLITENDEILTTENEFYLTTE